MTWPTRSRKDRTLRERVHDTYASRTKPRGETVCSECGVVFTGGRWTWADRPHGANEALCPACKRIQDDYPGGVLTLRGNFLQAHREEIFKLIESVTDAERRDHPLNRIMEIEDLEDGILISTTDMHLPRRIGDAVARAYKGSLSHHYDIDGDFARVEWVRED